MLITRLERLGYAVEEHIIVGVSVLVITGTEPGPQITSGYLGQEHGPVLGPYATRRCSHRRRPSFDRLSAQRDRERSLAVRRVDLSCMM
jgi:hypothetical protein